MTDSNDRDFIGEVIAEDVAKRKLLAADNDRDMLEYLDESFQSQTNVCEQCGHEEPTSTCDSASDLRDYLESVPESELRQQLADVSNERDEAVSRRDMIHKQLSAWQGLASERLDMLNASEARNELLKSNLEECIIEMQLAIEDSAIRGAMTVVGRKRSLQLVQEWHTAQSAPATKPNLVECDVCPASSGCVNTCMKAPATDEQGVDAEKVNNRQMGLAQFVEKHPVEHSPVNAIRNTCEYMVKK